MYSAWTVRDTAEDGVEERKRKARLSTVNDAELVDRAANPVVVNQGKVRRMDEKTEDQHVEFSRNNGREGGLRCEVIIAPGIHTQATSRAGAFARSQGKFSSRLKLSLPLRSRRIACRRNSLSLSVYLF